MARSGNSFSKNRTADAILGQSVNSFSDVSFSAGSNTFADTVFVAGQYQWDGENVALDAFGFDDLFSGKPFGAGNFGEITHFKRIL